MTMRNKNNSVREFYAAAVKEVVRAGDLVRNLEALHDMHDCKATSSRPTPFTTLRVPTCHFCDRLVEDMVDRYTKG